MAACASYAFAQPAPPQAQQTRQQEADRAMAEAQAQMDARMKETDARMKEVEARMKEADARMREAQARGGEDLDRAMTFSIDSKFDFDFDAIQEQVDRAMSAVDRWKVDDLIAQAAPVAPAPPMPPMVKSFNFSYGGGSYEQGKSQLNLHHYDKAVETFDRVINAREASPRQEGAYYWKAYALNRLGKRDEALATLDELQKKFPQGSWVSDAKALRAEVQAAKGQPISPDAEADEDLKLYAINALMGSDPERAVPLLEGLLNNPKMGPRLKERALFVLAQSGSDKAHEIVARYAKGASNPDLQVTALEYLGTFRSKESRQVLADAYASSHDLNVRRAVLRGYERSRDVEHLAAAAKSEQNPELRAEAIRGLGSVHDEQAVSSLVSLYGSESERNIKREILHSLSSNGSAKPLIDCARKESDPELKRTAVQLLGSMKSKEAMDYIAELLK